jgi:predicted transcriptional regulator
MAEYRLGEIESKFADIIWDNEPLSSPELVKLAEDSIGWKKSTTYTILKRLCERGLFRNENATVTSLVSRDEFFAGQSRDFVKHTFGGSLPKFITSFIGGKRLTDKQADELVRLINAHKAGDGNG